MLTQAITKHPPLAHLNSRHPERSEGPLYWFLQLQLQLSLSLSLQLSLLFLLSSRRDLLLSLPLFLFLR